jgi:iron complex outermembrane receptor protein
MMKSLVLSVLLTVLACMASAQHTLQVEVRNAGGDPVSGATVSIKGISTAVITDSSGTALFINLPGGVHPYTISAVGYAVYEGSVNIPFRDPLVIVLDAEDEEEEEVVVTTTRTSRTITQTPTRVEIISGEELAEKGNMKPGDIRMLLNESTGIQTQQTSATSYNSAIRIQGLDGRYTQVLRDGLPLYAGFSGGLSIMQIAPLDLKQVEVIKGAASTLYGGGAIAGLVNLVSKNPGEESETSFLVNGTSAKGLDLSGFYSERFGKLGATVFASRNSNASYDPAGIGLTAIPKFSRYTLNPRLFYYGKQIDAHVGLSYIYENRLGGSIAYIRDNKPGYFERNLTNRLSAQGVLNIKTGERTALHFRNSISRFRRQLFEGSTYAFAGIQTSGYSELNLQYDRPKSNWIAGINIVTDNFREDQLSAPVLRNYDLVTKGAFVQHTWEPTSTFVMETGLRVDHVSHYGSEVLPRWSGLLRLTPTFNIRLGGGMGYKAPTPFNEETERLQYQNVLPLDPGGFRNERSVGGNIDFNYRFELGFVRVSVNQLFFYTKLNHLLLLEQNSTGNFQLQQPGSHVTSMGTESNLRFLFNDFKLFVGYTYVDANRFNRGSKSWLPLTSRHRLNNVLMYEIEDKLKLGLEAYYFSPQRLNDGTTGRDYWIAGFMAEKLWENFSLFINFENFTDTRQTKFDSIFTGPLNDPVFRDIYAPVDGFVVNGGIKIRL